MVDMLTTNHNRLCMFNSPAFIGAGSLIVAVGFVSCEDRMMAVALLTLAVGVEGMVYGGYMTNYVDFAPA